MTRRSLLLLSLAILGCQRSEPTSNPSGQPEPVRLGDPIGRSLRPVFIGRRDSREEFALDDGPVTLRIGENGLRFSARGASNANSLAVLHWGVVGAVGSQPQVEQLSEGIARAYHGASATQQDLVRADRLRCRTAAQTGTAAAIAPVAIIGSGANADPFRLTACCGRCLLLAGRVERVGGNTVGVGTARIPGASDH